MWVGLWYIDTKCYNMIIYAGLLSSFRRCDVLGFVGCLCFLLGFSCAPWWKSERKSSFFLRCLIRRVWYRIDDIIKSSATSLLISLCNG